MLTRTLPSNEIPAIQIQEQIEETVDERGFYLYDWITPDELRMSVQADYLSIVKMASIPLAIVTLIAGFIGLGAGFIGVLLAVFGVLFLFYSFVLVILIILMVRKSYLYTRGADVVITDKHYVTGGKVLSKDDFAGQKEAFSSMEKVFREPLFEPSKLKEYVDLEKKNLFEQLKDIMMGGGKIVENLGRSRDSGGIIMVLLVVGVLYGAMMGLVYFIGVFFVAILARLFSWVANRALLAMNNTEHTIQSLFSEIAEASIELKEERKNSVTLLTEAGRNEWADSLSSRLNESFEIISTRAKAATEKSVKLSSLLENSKYKDIFNFGKYGNWVKIQILTPIEEILELIEKNLITLEHTAGMLEKEISKTTEPSHKRPLELQSERILLQRENFERVKTLLKGYKEKLESKATL